MKTKNIYLKSAALKLFLILLVGSSIIFSCQQDEPESIISTAITNSSDKLKVEFSKSLAVAITNEPEVRKFLKQEAMKMMDGDFDIIYELVKNERLGNNKPLNRLFQVILTALKT